MYECWRVHKLREQLFFAHEVSGFHCTLLRRRSQAGYLVVPRIHRISKFADPPPPPSCHTARAEVIALPMEHKPLLVINEDNKHHSTASRIDTTAPRERTPVRRVSSRDNSAEQRCDRSPPPEATPTPLDEAFCDVVSLGGNSWVWSALSFAWYVVVDVWYVYVSGFWFDAIEDWSTNSTWRCLRRSRGVV